MDGNGRAEGREGGQAASAAALPFGGLPSVRMEVVPAARTDGGPPWYTLRITSSGGGSHEFGFEPTAEKVVEKWAFEACVFALSWSQPPGVHPIPEGARG